MTKDLDEVDYALSTVLTQGILMILTIVAAIITIFINDWKLAIIALVGPLLLFARDRTRLT